jgi:hypothetical protein
MLLPLLLLWLLLWLLPLLLPLLFLLWPFHVPLELRSIGRTIASRSLSCIILPSIKTAVGPQSAQAPRAAGQFVCGVANTTAITYSNHCAEVVAFLNSKDTTPPPAMRMADRCLVNVGRTMANTLVVYIMECLHYLLVSGISERILTNRMICGKNSRPDPHVNTAKVQMAAQVIKVVTFGLDTSVECLFQCKGTFSSPDSVLFLEYAIEFLVTHLSWVEYKFQP